MALVSRLVQVIDVEAGERVGYGGIYTVPEQGVRLGVVPAGHHDCVPRAFSNFGHVMIAGVRCPIVGRVSMDSMTVDVTGCPSAVVGSDVLIYGRRGDWQVPLEEVSAAVGSNAHEVMARVGPRVQRIFTNH
jgi:alanine racemase